MMTLTNWLNLRSTATSDNLDKIGKVFKEDQSGFESRPK